MRGPLGRRTPTDFWHVDRYPLTAGIVPTTPVPVWTGWNWYSDFDTPRDAAGNAYRPGASPVGGKWWVGRDPKRLGYVRGGHSICIEPGDELDATGKVIRKLQDIAGWWEFYDQGEEGACVGFAGSRMMSLLNRRRYFARWLWDLAKASDEWDDTNPGDDNGTSVHAAAVMLMRGHVVWKTTYEQLSWQQRDRLPPAPAEGIASVRWARTADDIRVALKSPAVERAGAIRFLNSWNVSYPHRTWMPLETVQRLMDEDGEAALVTDR